jgi:hypothetical protein
MLNFLEGCLVAACCAQVLGILGVLFGSAVNAGRLIVQNSLYYAFSFCADVIELDNV